MTKELSPLWRGLFFALPLFLLALTAMDIALWELGKNASQLQWMKMVTNFLFFNALHVVLSFAILIFSKPGRGIAERSKAWLKLLPFASFMLVLFFMSRAYLPHKSSEEIQAYLLVLPLVLLWPHYHSLWQVKGLLNFVAPEGQKPLNPKHSRILFWAIFLTFVPLQSSFLLADQAWMLSAAPSLSVITDFLQSQHQSFFWLNLVVTTVAFVFIAKQQPDRRSVVFALRLFLYPLSGLSWVAFFGVSMFHGVEYLCLFKKMSLRYEDGPYLWKRGLQMVAGFALIALPGYLAFWYNPLDNSTVALLAALASTIVFSHYYADALIFKMKDHQIREKILSLLGHRL